MSNTIDKDAVWIKSILLDTILREEDVKRLNLPSVLQLSIVNDVCRYAVKHIVIPDELSDELFLFCEFVDNPEKGCNSPTISKIFSEFFAKHIAVITLMMSVSPTTLN